MAEGASASLAAILEAWRQVPLGMECAVVGDSSTPHIVHTVRLGALLSSVAGPVDPALHGSEHLDPVLLVLHVGLRVEVVKGGDLGVRPKLKVRVAEVVGEHLHVEDSGVLEARDSIKIDRETRCN